MKAVLDHVGIAVSDLQASLAFFRDVLGLHVETTEEIALREYELLRDLQRLDQPAVVPRGVVTGRVDAAGEPLPAALLTEHLHYSLPYRTVFQHGLRAEQVPALAAGTYFFRCDVHPQMNGTVLVEAATAKE